MCYFLNKKYVTFRTVKSNLFDLQNHRPYLHPQILKCEALGFFVVEYFKSKRHIIKTGLVYWFRPWSPSTIHQKKSELGLRVLHRNMYLDINIQLACAYYPIENQFSALL